MIAMQSLHFVCFDLHYLNVKIAAERPLEHHEILSTLRYHYHPNPRFVLRCHSFPGASQIPRSLLHSMR